MPKKKLCKEGKKVIENTGNNLINTNIGRQTLGQSVPSKTSVNKYYNIFSKKMEEIELPNIDLEFNSVLKPEKSKFMWTA